MVGGGTPPPSLPDVPSGPCGSVCSPRNRGLHTGAQLCIHATTAPFSNIDNVFDVVDLSKAAGATFVARTTTYHAKEISDLIRKAIIHEGFSVVEILTQCPTYFGRKNKEGSAVDMLRRYNETTTPIGSKAKKEKPDLVERGIFVQQDMPEYCNEYDKIIQRAMEG